MTEFEPIVPGIRRLYVPFEDVQTSVFLVGTDEGAAIIDSASCDGDVAAYVLPALARAGVTAADVRFILASHAHGDHMGGHAALTAAFPAARVGLPDGRAASPEWDSFAPRDGETLLGCLTVLHLPGHSADAAGFLDTRTNTLISGDALQLWGVGRYGCGLFLPREYERTVDRLLGMEIETISASHEYFPLGSVARGRGAVREYLTACRDICGRIRAFAEDERANGRVDPAEITSRFNAAREPGCPTLQAFTVEAMLAGK